MKTRTISGEAARAIGRVQWAVLAALLSLAAVSCDRKGDGSSPPVPPAPPATPTESRPSSSSPAPRAEFEKLQGRWLRPDGNYVLEIKSVSAGGALEAAYYNPNPIRVAKAEVKMEGTAAKVFVELRDAGYPGCTYTLTHDAQSDQLVGVYFQAAMGESFDVVFTRLR